MEQEGFESTNINSKWLENIFENIKNIENAYRLAREGCSTVIEYLQIPTEHREIIIPDIQYKNLKLIISELDLLVTDANPVIGDTKTEEYRKKIEPLLNAMSQRKLFLHEPYSQVKKQISYRELTPFFWNTLDFVTRIKQDLIRDLSSILFVKSKGAEELTTNRLT